MIGGLRLHVEEQMSIFLTEQRPECIIFNNQIDSHIALNMSYVSVHSINVHKELISY